MRLLFAFAVLAFTVPTAQAQSFESPEALIESLYAGNIIESSDDAPSPYSAYYSRGLNRLLQEDRDATPQGEVGAIDFDPVIASQDGMAENVEMTPPILIDDTAELEVSFSNGEPVTLYYTLVREQGGWKVDDIANQQGDYPWSLRDLLSQ
ncbi:MAG: DUF3828 domain-containing protein [Pseudorhizobium sp.]